MAVDPAGRAHHDGSDAAVVVAWSRAADAAWAGDLVRACDRGTPARAGQLLAWRVACRSVLVVVAARDVVWLDCGRRPWRLLLRRRRLGDADRVSSRSRPSTGGGVCAGSCRLLRAARRDAWHRLSARSADPRILGLAPVAWCGASWWRSPRQRVAGGARRRIRATRSRLATRSADAAARARHVCECRRRWRGRDVHVCAESSR